MREAGLPLHPHLVRPAAPTVEGARETTPALLAGAVRPPALFPPGTVPTTENLVRVIWDLLAPKLAAERLHRLRLWEDPTFYVEYLCE